MLSHDRGDGQVIGATRKSGQAIWFLDHAFDIRGNPNAVGITALPHRGRNVLLGDTLVRGWPEEEDLATTAEAGVGVARAMGIEPRR